MGNFAKPAGKVCAWLLLAVLLIGAQACGDDGEKPKADKGPGPEIAFVKSCNHLEDKDGRLLLTKEQDGSDAQTLGQVFASYPAFQKTGWGLLEKKGRKVVIASGLIYTREQVADIIKGLKDKGQDFLDLADDKSIDRKGFSQERINQILDDLLKLNTEYSMVMAFALHPDGGKARLTLFSGVLTNPQNRWVHLERKVADPKLTLKNLHDNIAASKLEKVLAEAVLFSKQPEK